MTKAKEIVVLIMSWLTGVGVTITGIMILDLRPWLLPVGIAIMLTTLGLDIGFNFIPHAQANIEERRLFIEEKKLLLEKQPVKSIPLNATIKSIPIKQTPSLTKAIKGFVEAISPEPEVEEKKDDFPL